MVSTWYFVLVKLTILKILCLMLDWFMKFSQETSIKPMRIQLRMVGDSGHISIFAGDHLLDFASDRTTGQIQTLGELPDSTLASSVQISVMDMASVWREDAGEGTPPGLFLSFYDSLPSNKILDTLFSY